MADPTAVARASIVAFVPLRPCALRLMNATNGQRRTSAPGEAAGAFRVPARAPAALDAAITTAVTAVTTESSRTHLSRRRNVIRVLRISAFPS